MTKEQAKNRIDELNKLTAYYAKKYYDDDDPEISDFEYDMLMVELKNLENTYPEFITKDSLTQHVGGNVKEGFEKVAIDFEHIAGIEHVHANRFKNILVKLNSQGLYKDSATQNWMCLNCGFIYEGMQVPLKCPVCMYPKGYFIHLSKPPIMLMKHREKSNYFHIYLKLLLRTQNSSLLHLS